MKLRSLSFSNMMHIMATYCPEKYKIICHAEATRNSLQHCFHPVTYFAGKNVKIKIF